MFSQTIHEQLYKIITEKYKYLQHYAQTDREPEMMSRSMSIYVLFQLF